MMSFLGGDGGANGLVCQAARDDGGDDYVPVPLVKVDVRARVVNFVSQVEVTQEYINKEANPIEAIYFFPVEEDAAVVNFTAELEGRSIKMKVKEKEKAKKKYDEAIRSRRTAFLLEETKPDIFQIKVGDLAPGSSCTIAITYLSELPVEDGRTRLTIPTTIAPRYIPHDDKSEAAEKIASIGYASKTPANMTFKLDTIMKTKIKGIESPSHKIISKIEDHQDESDDSHFFVAETKFGGSINDMDRDIVVLIETEEPNQPKIILEKNEDGSTVAMLSLVPSFQLKDTKVEIVFLVDCSGSMGGKSIKLAKEALQLFLHSLPMDCYFNIICFGSSFEALFPESKKYDDITLESAKKLAANLSADLGGTEILKPLEHILKQNPIPGHPRQVFVLTDGEVSDSSRCISCVKSNNSTSRVFTLGIGASSDRHLVKGMARAGQGTAVFATYGEKLAPKVLKQLKNSLQPCINNVRVDWADDVDKNNPKCRTPKIETSKTLMGYGKIKKNAAGISEVQHNCTDNQAPMSVPAIYDGSRLLVYKKLTDSDYPESVKVTAETPDGDLNLFLPVEKDNILEGNSVHQMFARKLIQDLNEYNGEANFDSDLNNAEYIKSQIIDLAIKYNLASNFTSFVGVDDKQGKEGEVIMIRQIKNQLAYGYGDSQSDDSGSEDESCIQAFEFDDSQMEVPCYKSYAVEMEESLTDDSDSEVEESLTLQSKDDMGIGLLDDGGVGNSHIMYEGLLTSNDETVVEDHEDIESDDDMGFDLWGVVGAGSSYNCTVKDEEGESPKDISNQEAKKTETEELIEIISLQIANGSFKWGDIIENITGKSLDEIKSVAGDNGVDSDSWLTAMVVIVIETKFKHDEESWEMIVDKAKKWMKTSLKNYDNLAQKVKEFLD